MKKFTVSVDDKLCKACGICIGLCPQNVLGENHLGKAMVIREDKCIGCKLCELHCPDYCIEVGENHDKK